MVKSMVWSTVMLAVLQTMALAAPARQRLSMDAGWRFHLGDPAGSEALSGLPITRWRWRAEARGEASAAEMAAVGVNTAGGDWQEAAPGQDVFGGRPGFAWFRVTLPAALPASVPDRAPRRLHFESVDDNATIYLNGQKLLKHSGWGEAFDVPLDAAWRAGTANELAVLIENNNGPGSIGATVLQSGEAQAPPASRPVYADRAWRAVHLPHDFVVEGTFDPAANESHGYLPANAGWYRKTFNVPKAARGQRLWIDFDGVYRNSRVWLNGRLLGHQPSGYSSFRYDISDAVRYGGPNVLAVRADARAFEGWWYEGGGIYRHVWLNIAAPLHVAPWGTFVAAAVQGNRATLAIKTEVANHSKAPLACRLVSEVRTADGQIAGSAASHHSLPAGQTVELTQTTMIAAPHLWSLETPYLYRLETKVLRGGKVIDSVSTPFGIRTIRFDANQGFFLNGKPVKIKGTCNHQDFAAVGVALPDHLQYWRIAKLKEMGSNAYRTSHNPPTAELLDACDRLGMLVLDEARHLGDATSAKSPPGTPYSDLSELSGLVKRDRNHPSVIMWSLANEEPLQGSEEGGRIGAAMKARISQLDGTRPVTAAMNGGFGGGLSNVVDVQGFNYSIGAYDNYHRSHPQQPLHGSETASALSDRGIYANDTARAYVSAYDVNKPGWGNTAEEAWRALGERPFMAGGFVWTGFDYRGEPTPYSWPNVNSHFGIMDMCGFPKDTYFYYQAWWGNKPIVHILPHWNWPGREGQSINVWCHSNCGTVELFLNGQSLGLKTMPRLGHLEWQVPYAPGKLEARGYNGGTLAATDVVETVGAPARLQLKPDRRAMQADGEDVIVVEVAVADAQNRLVPTADNQVNFQVSGAAHIAGVGNGDPSSHEPDKASQRRAFNGRCLVIVQANERPGPIQLTATSPGLPPVTLRFAAR